MIVGLVALGIILALVGAGVFNASGPNPSTPTYARASPPANQVSATVAGGPWHLVAAAGFDTPTAASISVGTSVGGNCSYQPAGSGPTPSTLYIPAFHGDLSSGGSPWWGMIYDQPTTHKVLVVQVLNGTAQALVVGSGSCVSTFQNFTTIPSNVVDSSVAAAAAWSQGGSAFEATHSSLSINMEMALLGGGSIGGVPLVGPLWVVEFSPCGPSGSGGPSGTQPAFEAIVNALSGNLTLGEVTTTQCGSSGPTTTPLGSVFALGNPIGLQATSSTVGCVSGDFCYQATVEVVSGTLTPANLTFSVTTATGALAPGVLGFSILSPSNQVVVSAAGNPSSLLWTSGTGDSMTPLVAGMTIVADVGTTNPTGLGYLLETTGLGSFTGTVTLSLP